MIEYGRFEDDYMIELDRFESFLYVSDYFNHELSFYRALCNNRNSLHYCILGTDKSITFSYTLNNISFNIANDLKAISIFDDEITSKFFDGLMDKYKLREVFTCDGEMSSYEIIQSIRNCLAHSNYSCTIDYINDIKLVHINNYKISGTLDMPTLQAIFTDINNYRISLDKPKYKYVDIDDICNLKTHNKSNYDRAFHMKKVLFSDDSTETLSDLTRDEMNLIRYYIDYYGLTQWIRLKPSQREYLLNQLIPVLNSGDLSCHLCIQFNDYFMRYILSKRYDYEMPYRINGLGVAFYSPIMYSNALLKYSFYVFNYLKESSSKEGFSSYIYRDLDISKINFKNQDNERYVKYVCDSMVGELYNKSLAEEKKLKEKLQCINDSIEKIASSDMNDEDKKEKVKKITSSVEKTKSDLVRRIAITKDLEKRMKNSSSYNYAELFRRLRNSISHGNYKIDYMSALKSKNLDNMVINFFDNEYGNSFNVEIRASDLLDIFGQIIENMKKNAKYFQDEKEIMIDLKEDLPVDVFKSTFDKLSSNTKITYIPTKAVIVDNKIKKTI